MDLCSTNDVSNLVSLRKAVLQGLPEDNGLYMPIRIPVLPRIFFKKQIFDLALPEIAFEVSKHFFDGSVPDAELRNIVNRAIDFPAPLVKIDDSLAILELFHGPSMAFKDFGARFMGQLMSYFNRGAKDELVILVATSGDTGGAVAAGFHHAPGIHVVILYPSGKVSELQEKQLTTYTGNITAIEVLGTFDDCQTLVKQAFLDRELREKIRLTSANSINIARLIPQMFYYFEAYKEACRTYGEDIEPVFVVPSGNFGNLTAGVMAHKMGLPVASFVAATNVNDVIPSYLRTGRYLPKPARRTLSNAMDVGDPSNFRRMKSIFGSFGKLDDGSTWNNMKGSLLGFSFDDKETERMMHDFSRDRGYLLDPHTAVGVLAAERFRKDYQGGGEAGSPVIVLSTAHPVKFATEVKGVYFGDISPVVPDKALEFLGMEKKSQLSNVDFVEFKGFLSSRFG